MKILVDKIFIDFLNDEYDLNLTYSDFKKFYSEIVKPARNSNSLFIHRRTLNEKINTLSIMGAESDK